MAAAARLICTPHMSGSGHGYINVLHFASYTPNVGPHQEFKGEAGIPTSSDTSSLRCERGIVRCPAGPGMGGDYRSRLRAPGASGFALTSGRSASSSVLTWFDRLRRTAAR
jgi:hypothetical protein